MLIRQYDTNVGGGKNPYFYLNKPTLEALRIESRQKFKLYVVAPNTLVFTRKPDAEVIAALKELVKDLEVEVREEINSDDKPAITAAPS